MNRTFSEAAPAAPPALIVALPCELHYVTSEEPRALMEAIAHGRSGRGWASAQGGRVRVHKDRPNGHEVRLSVPNPPEEWGAAELCRKLDATLAEWDLDVAFLAAVTVSTLAEGTRLHAAAVASRALAPVAELTVDHLLKGMGKNIESRQERNEERRWVRKRLLEISGALVVGARQGTYPRPGSNEREDTYQNEALFHVIDAETTWQGSQPSFDGSGVPLCLRIHGGGLFCRIAQNPSMLQYLGNLRALAEIPGGKAGGQWARAMGLAFAQFTREEAAKPRPRRSLSRRALLTRFPPDPSAEEILKGDHPKRALKYWREAKEGLIRIGWWRPFDEPPKPAVRYEWGEAWLDQEIEPPPGPILEGPLPELAAGAEAARRRRAPRKKLVV